MVNITEMTDEQLAVRYIEGDNDAFDLLLERTKDGLFNYILYVVRQEDIANDVFQDTFVKALVCLQQGRYNPSGKFAAWLVRIAHNVIMDNYRHIRMTPTVDANPDNDLSNLSVESLIGVSRETQISNRQVLADVKRIMEFLPAKQREVVYMRYYQDLSFKEIAEATGVSINTSLGRMRYAVMNMRKLAKQHNVSLNLD